MQQNDRVTRTLNTINGVVRDHFAFFCGILLCVNLVGSYFIIHLVPYTEIDWETYMIQVSLIFDENQYDYQQIKGPTGPLVYPAGHVYIYEALRKLTKNGKDIRLAQYIFSLFYTISLFLIIQIYKKYINNNNQIKYRQNFVYYLIPILFMSRRIVSLFILRLFNDAVQSMFIYLSILLFMNNQWEIGCFIYSLSISIKMNTLLYAPGLTILLCQSIGFWRAILYAFVLCLPVQLILAYPFLKYDTIAYVSRALELTRKFLYKWSVNGAFLPESIFTSSSLSILLVTLHLCTLLCLAHFKWTSNQYGLFGLLKNSIANLKVQRKSLNPSHVLFVLFSSNFVGIVFSRTLHYQFYTWYFHSLPFLISGGPFPLWFGVVCVVVIEVIFNVYPPHWLAAAVLSMAHFIILFSLFKEKQATDQKIYVQNEKHKVK